MEIYGLSWPSLLCCFSRHTYVLLSLETQENSRALPHGREPALMAGINVVFAVTPRGVLGKCFRCGLKMRLCHCFKVQNPPRQGTKDMSVPV